MLDILKLYRNFKMSRRVNRKKSILDEKSFLVFLGGSGNAIQRSYKQYLCQVYVEGMFFHFLLNLLSILPFIAVLVLVGISNIFYVMKGELVVKRCKEIRMPNVNLKESEISVFNSKGRVFFIRDFFRIVSQLPFSVITPYYLLLSILTLSKFRYLILVHQPEKLYVSMEYSFSSSLVFDLCCGDSIEMINVMHGEKLFDIVDAYSTCHTLIVWQEYYLKLFGELNVKWFESIIYDPFSACLDVSKKDQLEAICYYDQGANYRALKKIQMKIFTVFDVFVLRPHPIYSRLKDTNKHEFLIDANREIISSLESYKYVCSQYSTILYICLSNGKSVLVDDLTVGINDLRDRSYTFNFFNENIEYLSDTLRKRC